MAELPLLALRRERLCPSVAPTMVAMGKATMDQENCNICFEPLGTDETWTGSGPVWTVACTNAHMFHKKCLAGVVRANPVCPDCRSPVIADIATDVTQPVPPPHVNTYAMYIRITPSAASMANPEVAKAVASQEKWGGLHVTLTSFAVRRQASQEQAFLPGIGVHGASMVAVLKRFVGPLRGWRLHQQDMSRGGTPTEGQLKFKSLKLRNMLDAFHHEGLIGARDGKGLHVSIGDADYDQVKAALTDPSTTYALVIAVRRKFFTPRSNPPAEKVVRDNEVTQLHP